MGSKLRGTHLKKLENPKKHHILSWFACHFFKLPHFPKVWWFFCIENLLFKSLTVMAWYGASNWAIRKLSEGIIVQVMSNIVKHVIYHGNLSKIHSFAKNAKFHNFLVPWIFLDGTTGKLRSQAFRISITLIGFLLK